MLSISDDDIDTVEKILLPQREKFDADRRQAIKCLENKDILACPGSGKTTALLAKLLIISKHLPLQSNKGLCVLTHTNVAINELKEKMGISSKKLFSYPNHFGTIQTFVDRFLAIPEYINRFGKRPIWIDNDFYSDSIERNYHQLNYGTRVWLEKRKDYLDFLKGIRFRPSDFVLVESLNGSEIFKDKNSKVYNDILRFKNYLLEKGILGFDDAYSLAFQYILKIKNIKNVFSERFAYVFIDEMQDTDTHQIELLKMLFELPKVVMQRTGDQNQAIYNAAKEENVWDVRPQPLQIVGSKRFSNRIANTVKKVCLSPQDMNGNPNVGNINPVIIAFDDNRIDKVIPIFGDLILKNNLHLEKTKVFKAIGWTGKKNDKYHTILSYWKKYNREVQTKKADFDNLWNYLTPLDDKIINKDGANVYKKSIIRAFLKVLRLFDIYYQNGVPFNEKTILKYLSEKDSKFYQGFLLKLTDWCLAIHNHEDIWSKIKKFIETDLKNLFEIQNLNTAQFFLSDITPEPQIQLSFQQSNTYEHHSQVKIEISTIHGVKGETHTATLYLETFYHDYDIKRILEYLKGNHSTPTKKYVIQNLKMSYVGMSRPSHFLCVAVHRAHLRGHEEHLLKAGWEINFELTTN